MHANAVDIDKETIHFDGSWLSREELAATIRKKLDAGDYAISRHSAALETLSQAVADVRTVTFRTTAALAQDLETAAHKEGRTTSALLRDAVARYLAMPRETPESKPALKEPDHRAPEGRRATNPELEAVQGGPPPGLQPAGSHHAGGASAPQPSGPVPGPGALRNAGVADAPAPVPSVVVTEPASAEEAQNAVDLTPRVERGWFGS